MNYGEKVCTILNVLQKVTIIIVNHVYNFTRATSKIWKNPDRIVNYVIVDRRIGPRPIHQLLR